MCTCQVSYWTRRRGPALPLIVASATPIRPPSSPSSFNHPTATIHHLGPQLQLPSNCALQPPRRPVVIFHRFRPKARRGANSIHSFTLATAQTRSQERGEPHVPIEKGEDHAAHGPPRTPFYRSTTQDTPSHVSSRSWIRVTIIPPPARTDYHARQDGDYRTLAISTGTTSNRAFSSPFDLHARTSLAPSLQLASWD